MASTSATVTQKQIAEELGVSREWVTRALNNYPSVPLESRQKVHETARRLGYNEHSNRDARAMIARRYGKRLRSGVVAVLMPADFYGTPLREVPFFMPLLDGIESEAARFGMDVLLCSPRGASLPRYLGERLVDGIIGIAQGDAIWRQCQALSLPLASLVMFDKATHQLKPRDSEGAFEIVQHLTGLGHRRIGYLSLDRAGHAVAAERFAGYRKALRAARLPLDESLVEATLTAANAEAGESGFKRLWQRRPDITAVFCVNDLVAMGALHQSRAYGLDVPQDLSIGGFNDFATPYDVKPALTSVAFPRLQMGKRAMQLLYADIERRETDKVGEEIEGEYQSEMFKGKLVVRESTAAPATSRPSR